MIVGKSSGGERTLKRRQRSRTAGATSWPRRGSSILSVRASDEFPDEAQQIGLALATETFRGNDRPNVLQTLVHVVVDQDVIIFRPVADFAGGALHPPGDDLFAVGRSLVQAAFQ